MAFRKKEIPAGINEAITRLSAMQQIDTNKGTPVDYGGPGRTITSATFSAKIKNYNDTLTIYNNLLEQADATGNNLNAIAKDVASDYSAVLSSAVGKFGADANEIEMLGGTRAEERKKPKRKAPTKA